MTIIASATFKDQTSASAAIAQLREIGLTNDHMSVMTKNDHGDGAEGEPGVGMGIDGDADRFMDKQGDQELTEQGQRHAARGLMGGGALGGLLAVAMLAIPGVGPIAAAGTVAAMLTGGVALGASLGGLREILTKHGLDDDQATAAENAITAGGVYVSIGDSDGRPVDIGRVEEIIDTNGGTMVSRAHEAA